MGAQQCEWHCDVATQETKELLKELLIDGRLSLAVHNSLGISEQCGSRESIQNGGSYELSSDNTHQCTQGRCTLARQTGPAMSVASTSGRVAVRFREGVVYMTHLVSVIHGHFSTKHS